LALIRQAHAKAAAAEGSVPTQLRLIVAVDQMEEEPPEHKSNKLRNAGT
jgi:hypothetical protein